MSSLAETIETRCQAFAQELTAVVMDAVRDAFGRKADRDELKRTPRAGATVRRIEPRPAPPRGAKRAPEALLQLQVALHAYVHANPGQRIEQIAEGMQLTTRELVLPIKKLIASKRIHSKGVKRATRYFPPGKGS